MYEIQLIPPTTKVCTHPVSLTNGHEIGSGNQIKKHRLIDRLDKVTVPILLDNSIEGIVLEGGLDLDQWLLVVVLEELDHLLEAGSVDLDDFDVLGTVVVVLVLAGLRILDGLGETGGGVRPEWALQKNDGGYGKG